MIMSFQPGILTGIRGCEIKLIFYDFEVFAHNWLVVAKDTNTREEHIIIDDVGALGRFHAERVNEIWVGFNSRHYDQYILKGILCGFNPKRVSDYIFKEGNPGWMYSSLLKKIRLNNYDVMMNNDRGLKTFEGFMGHDIQESSVPFDIGRPLTKAEIDETVQYCRHDVEQTMEIFIKRNAEFEAHLGLVKLACGNKPLDLSLISMTNPQLAAIILNARKLPWNDEFDIDFPSTMRVEKYTAVLDWYKNPENLCYDKGGRKNKLDIMVAGVPHQFGYGGIHGALRRYHGKGLFLNMDVASLYPALMIKYNLEIGRAHV
jgi:DNA polymerase